MRKLFFILFLIPVLSYGQVVSVSIMASNNPVLPATSVTFTATPTNGGTTPATSNTITMTVANGIPCYSGATVDYGGVTYNTVQIGTQCWLKENLNIGTEISIETEQTDNSEIEKWCIDCDIYGGLYQWAEMVQYLNGATNTTNWSPTPVGNVQGLCPTGWHIPTNAELNMLYTGLGGISVSGGKMKTTGTTQWGNSVDVCYIVNIGATNLSGFSMLPGGVINNNIARYEHIDGIFWLTGPGALYATDALYGGASYCINAALNGQMYKNTGLSIRCLKD